MPPFSKTWNHKCIEYLCNSFILHFVRWSSVGEPETFSFIYEKLCSAQLFEL